MGTDALNVEEADFDIADFALYLDDAQGNVEEATAELAEARNTDVNVLADGAESARDFNNDSSSFTTLINGRASDARLQQVVDAAQAAVNADSNRYDAEGNLMYRVTAEDTALTGTDGISEGDYVPGEIVDGEVAATTDATSDDVVSSVFSARQLQSRLNSAESTLAGDVTRNGDTLTIASDLSDAIGSFLAQNDTLSTELQAVRDQYLLVLAEVQGGDDNPDLAAWKGAIDTAIEAAFGVTFAEEGDDRSDVARANADEDLSAGIVNGLLALNTRFTNEERVDAREEAFGVVDAGNDYLLAVELQEDRAEAIEKLTDAQAVVEALETAFAEYEAAGEAVDAAAEALGYDVVSVDDGILFGEADTDELFVFNADDLDDLSITDVTVNDLEAGDALFFGTDYSLGGETGDNNALEFFVSTNIAGDVVVNVENSAFGSAQNDSYNVTLTGISEDQLNIDGGVISIVEVA